MSRKYNTRLIKTRRSYSTQDISALFGIGKRTCFRWIEEGLEVIDPTAKPLLIMGYDLKVFLDKKQNKAKAKMEKDEYFCLHCRKPVKAKLGSDRIEPTGKKIGKDDRKQIMKIGLCDVCNGEIYRLA